MIQAAKSEFEKAVAAAIEHQKAGRLRGAGAGYRPAPAASPGHPPATQTLGVVMAALGDHRAAIDCFDRAIAIEPNYASAHYNRGIACAALGDAASAIRSFSRACAIEPEH